MGQNPQRSVDPEDATTLHPGGSGEESGEPRPCFRGIASNAILRNRPQLEMKYPTGTHAMPATRIPVGPMFVTAPVAMLMVQR